MAVVNYSYNSNTYPLKGLGGNYAPAVTTLSPIQPEYNASSLSNGDTIVLHGLTPTNNNQFINFHPSAKADGIEGLINSILSSVNDPKSRFNMLSGDDNVDQVIEGLNTIPDESERSGQLRDYFIRLLDEDNYNGAIKALNATPILIYKNSMFKGLIQELVSNGKTDSAIKLTNNYPDQRIKNELNNYIADYLNYYGNDSTRAAEVLGDSSIFNIAKLKTETILGSVGSFFSGIGHSITSIFTTSPKSSIMAYNAENTVGKKFRYDFLDGGNLACAYAVSQMIKGVPGLERVGSASCNTLANQLWANGFSKVYGNNYQPIRGKVNYQPGDIVFFTRAGKDGYGHVGMVSEVRNGIPFMVHNSSSTRAVVKVRLDQYYKTPVAVFRANG